MLTADLAQSWQRGGRTGPRYIAADDATLLQAAAELLQLFAAYEHRTRGELNAALAEYVGTGTDYRIQRGLIKLLTDRCTFETVAAQDPLTLRRALFRGARARHPLTADSPAAAELLTEVARALDCPPEVISAALYADLPERQQLVAFARITPQALLDLYNVAQAQALLYRCVRLQLWLEPQTAEGYRELFGAIKAYRLLHTIKGDAAGGYEVSLDGPVSLFHRAQKYGVQMAVFLPALLLCAGWRMRAEIALKPPGGGSAIFALDSRQTQLRSHYLTATGYEPPTLAQLAAAWAEFETPWTLATSSAVISLGAGAFIPDYVLTHPDGRQVYLEVLGFWTPNYLQARLAECAQAGVQNFLLAAWDELRGSRDPLARVPANTLIYKSRLRPAAVVAAAEKLFAPGAAQT